jgi:hypothetical protein
MLWYKNFLETRQRLGFAVLWYALEVYALHRGSPKAGQITSAFATLWILSSVFSASTGIKTQAGGFAPAKGLHGSTYFTLSLPVSRATLFGVRTAIGLLEMAIIMVAATCSLWASFPALHDGNTLLTAAASGLATFACCLTFYFISAMMAIFLDPQWQLYGGVAIVWFCWWLTRDVQNRFNVFSTLGAPALVTHNIPWEAIAVSVVAAAILCSVTLRMIETHEF